MSDQTRLLTDKTAIRAFLSQDRALTAYALGDLDDAFWPDSIFYGASLDGQLVSVVLVYRGLNPAVLTAFGDPEGVRAVFAQQPLPEEIYYLFPPEMEGVLTEAYETPNSQREWRMVLDPRSFSFVREHVERLGPEHAAELAALYRQAADPGEEIVAFSPWQIEHGVFYGAREGGQLVSAAGTHVWSRAEGVVAIGNVFTVPEYRGRGYAGRCTAAVTEDALAAGLSSIVLNVRQDNGPAIRLYQRLGYRLYSVLLEGPGLMRP
jgi:ribosomal protein S18 acetylase RimI-like enzyme